MYRIIFNKFLLFASLLFIFIFFFIIEWRWQALLLGLPDVKPYLLLAVISIVVNILNFVFLNIKQKDKVFLIILFFIGYFIIVAIFNAKELAETHNYNNVTELGIWSINLALFLVASNKNVWTYIYRHYKIICVLYVLYIIPLFLLLMYRGSAVESNFNLKTAIWITGLVKNSAYGVDYQSMGDKLAILSFFFFSFNSRKNLRLFIVFVTFIALYVIGSKASMIGYIFACGGYYLISLVNNKHYVQCASIIFLLICLFCGVFWGVAGNKRLQNSDNWLIRSVARGTGDISISSRHIIEQENQKTRDERLLLGDYKFDYKLGRPGSYTHSALGIIDYYGVPIFLMLSGLWFYLFTKLLFKKSQIRIACVALMSMLFYTLLYAIARFPVINYLFYWTLGVAVLAISHQDMFGIKKEIERSNYAL